MNLYKAVCTTAECTWFEITICFNTCNFTKNTIQIKYCYQLLNSVTVVIKK